MADISRGGKPIISLRDVWKTYMMGNVRVDALRGVSLDVYKNEFIAIMGPSGSGKSTAMAIIGALDVPSRGKVFLEGYDISKLTESNLANIRGQKIGFVFQTFNLIGTLTALENVMLPMTFQGIPQTEKEKRAIELLRMVNLGDRITHKPSEMSGGERQRVAIARSLANNPEIILADEPTGNLDSRTGKIIMDIFIKLHEEQKKTIIMVTHDPYIATYAKDEKIYNIKDGKIRKSKEQYKKFVWAEKEKNGYGKAK